jgi:hypothetical protein
VATCTAFEPLVCRVWWCTVQHCWSVHVGMVCTEALVACMQAVAAGSFAAGVDAVQQLYAFLMPQRRDKQAAAAPEPSKSSSTPTVPAGGAQEAEAAVPPAPSAAGLTEYERELQAADATPAQQPQEQGQHQQADRLGGPAPSVTERAAGIATAAATVARKQGRHVGSKLWAWVRQGLRCASSSHLPTQGHADGPSAWFSGNSCCVCGQLPAVSLIDGSRA